MICKVLVRLMNTETDHPTWGCRVLRASDERRGPSKIYVRSLRTTIPTDSLGTITSNVRNDDPRGMLSYFVFCEEADVECNVARLKQRICEELQAMLTAAQDKLAFIDSHELVVEDPTDVQPRDVGSL